ncbi:hypothetical protein PIGHUM_02198 [Pigmentiphaga humi]|uniref:Uncharacterized protein n=1 Tax=Pigmentiphaga humi TaxID=2478468 RepID=A0A3P4B2L4_9BURK|nr:hypothetical protein PIGHUM_02198 [Pigmentiphaga humi]
MLSSDNQTDQVAPMEPYEAPAVEALGCWETITGSIIPP